MHAVALQLQRISLSPTLIAFGSFINGWFSSPHHRKRGFASAKTGIIWDTDEVGRGFCGFKLTSHLERKLGSKGSSKLDFQEQPVSGQRGKAPGPAPQVRGGTGVTLDPGRQQGVGAKYMWFVSLARS